MQINIFDLFGKERRKREKMREVYIASLVRDEMSIFYDRLKSVGQSQEHGYVPKVNELINTINSVCPNCKHNISEYNHTEIDKTFVDVGLNLETKMNKCDSCGNEWIYCSNIRDSLTWEASYYIRQVITHLQNVYNYNNCTYDASDPFERHHSLVDKKEALLKVVNEFYLIPTLQVLFYGISIDTLKYLIIKECLTFYLSDFKKYYNEKELLKLGLTKIK